MITPITDIIHFTKIRVIKEWCACFSGSEWFSLHNFAKPRTFRANNPIDNSREGRVQQEWGSRMLRLWWWLSLDQKRILIWFWMNCNPNRWCMLKPIKILRQRWRNLLGFFLFLGKMIRNCICSWPQSSSQSYPYIFSIPLPSWASSPVTFSPSEAAASPPTSWSTYRGYTSHCLCTCRD